MFLEIPKPTPHPAIPLIRRLLVIILLLIGLLVVGTILANLWICGSTHHAIYDSPEDVPKRQVALVLGTSKYIARGTPNPHFTQRVKAAADLYHVGNIQHLLVSGDNRTSYYNEPRDLKQSLVELGVPPQHITCDFAGLRTLDSVYRAQKVFGQESLVIISDDFHVYRALFIAKKKGIDAIGLKAQGVPRSISKKPRIREWFARVKAILDVYILGTEPRHYGDPIDILPQARPEDAQNTPLPTQKPLPLTP